MARACALLLCALLFNCSDPSLTLWNGDAAFYWEKNDGSYIGVLGGGFGTVARLERPFDYFIAQNATAKLRCSAKAETAKRQSHRLVATATLECEDGTQLDAKLIVTPAGETNAFDIEAITKANPGHGVGLRQELTVTLVPKADPFTVAPASRYEALIPGVWYKRNAHVEDCSPGISGGARLSVREDRGSAPTVALRGGTLAVALSRTQSAAFDSFPVTDASPAPGLFAGNAIFTQTGGGTDVSGIGFDLNDEAPSLTAYFPFYEGPYSMQRKVYAAEFTPIFDAYCRYSDVGGFLDWDLVRETRLRSTWRLAVLPAPDFGTLMSEHGRRSEALYAPAPRTPAKGAVVRTALAEFVAAHYDRSSSVAGFFHVMTVPSATVLLPYIEPGFTGRTFLNARYLLAEGRAQGRADWVAMAESVYDTWITAGTQGGAFYDLWDAARNLPANDRELNEPPDGFATRRDVEALWALIDAVSDEAARGVTRPTWKQAAKDHLDLYVRLARPDGSYCRRYSFKEKCLESNPGSTSAVVPALVHGYRLFGDERYLARARTAARFVGNNFIERAEYFASTIDNPSENKEAATYAFYAVRLVSEENGGDDNAWLRWAKMAADAALTWIQLTDVPFAPDTLLGRVGLETRGLGNVAAGGGNADAYAFEFPGSLVWLAQETGDERYENMARLVVGAAMDTVAVPGDMKGLAEVGMAPEGMQKTMFAYFTGEKGSYAPFSALGWTTASVFQAMDEVERVAGVPVDEFLAR